MFCWDLQAIIWSGLTIGFLSFRSRSTTTKKRLELKRKSYMAATMCSSHQFIVENESYLVDFKLWSVIDKLETNVEHIYRTRQIFMNSRSRFTFIRALTSPKPDLLCNFPDDASWCLTTIACIFSQALAARLHSLGTFRLHCQISDFSHKFPLL